MSDACVCGYVRVSVRVCVCACVYVGVWVCHVWVVVGVGVLYLINDSCEKRSTHTVGRRTAAEPAMTHHASQVGHRSSTLRHIMRMQIMTPPKNSSTTSPVTTREPAAP